MAGRVRVEAAVKIPASAAFGRSLPQSLLLLLVVVVVVVVVLLLLVLLLCGVIEPGGAAAAGLLVTGVHFLLLLLLSYTRCGPSAPGKGGCRLCMAMLSASKGPS
jgi:multisubunit Na+/H+ antiporter MnhB subunit